MLHKNLMAFAAIAILSSSVWAGEGSQFQHAPDPVGGLNPSALVVPDGSDWDQYAWDDFILAEPQTITKVRWRGGYINGAPYGHAIDFRVSFFASNVTGFEPLITALPSHESQETVIATFHTNGLASESFAGVFGGKVMYDYTFLLPQPVTLQASTRYWFRVVASQQLVPDWGMASGLGGNGSHFRYTEGYHTFNNWPHDLAFSLHSDWVNVGNALTGVAGEPSLIGSGVVTGAGGVTFEMASGPASALVWFVAGFSRIDQPLLGGVLVPDPLFILPMQMDASGGAQLSLVLPYWLSSGTDIVCQAWIADPLAVASFSASNGIMGTIQ